MDGYRKILSIIARRHPEIEDAINPHSLIDLVALNPQPLPPKEIGRSRVNPAALNPQPLPPAEIFGRHLVQLAYFADKVGLELRPIDEWASRSHGVDDPIDSLGDDSRVRALIEWLLANGVIPVPNPDEPKPISPAAVQVLLADIAVGIASGGSFAESNRFLSATMDGLAETLSTSELMSV